MESPAANVALAEIFGTGVLRLSEKSSLKATRFSLLC